MDARAQFGIDIYAAGPDVKVCGDATRLPFRDACIGGLISRHLVEHLPPGNGGRDPLFAFFDECHRVLVPGGRLEVETPHVKGVDAFADPTHRRFFVPKSFSHLWDARRDPHYPRKMWRLVDVTTARFFPHAERFRGHRLMDFAGRFVYDHIGKPNVIILTLEKP